MSHFIILIYSLIFYGFNFIIDLKNIKKKIDRYCDMLQLSYLDIL